MSVEKLARHGRRRRLNRDETYESTAIGIVWWRPTQNGPVAIQLTNFKAEIVAEIMRDDGAERSLRFEIEAAVAGELQRHFNIPASEFSSLVWAVRELGAKALVYPGMAIRDHARAAIQLLSNGIERREVFAHTGWRDGPDGPAYLHGGGAISAAGLVDDVETDLGELAGFELPAPPRKTLQRALDASLGVLDLGPLPIVAPVYAAVWRSVLGPADFALHLTGRTGLFKSELAAQAQQHFGAGLDARHLASWSSTANSLEAQAFVAKEALLVVDDFAPHGSQADVNLMMRSAARLIRAQGNRSGRQRMRPDGSLRPVKPPRGLILSTGEDIPSGWSLRARMLIIEVGQGDVNRDELTRCQRDAAAGRYAGAMSAYLCHLAGDLDGARERWREHRDRLREKVDGSGHRRTPFMVAELGAALHLFLEFAGATGRWEKCWAALVACGAAQVEHQIAEDPARKFIELVHSALVSRRAHVGNAHDAVNHPKGASYLGWEHRGDGYVPCGPQIGWRDGDALCLDPEAAYGLACRLSTEQGRP